MDDKEADERLAKAVLSLGPVEKALILSLAIRLARPSLQELPPCEPAFPDLPGTDGGSRQKALPASRN